MSARQAPWFLNALGCGAVLLTRRLTRRDWRRDDPRPQPLPALLRVDERLKDRLATTTTRNLDHRSRDRQVAIHPRADFFHVRRCGIWPLGQLRQSILF